MMQLRRIARVLVLFIGLPCLAVLVYVIVQFERTKKRDLVVFDNRLGAPAEIAIDGEIVDTLEPRTTTLVTLPEAAKKIVVTSQGRVTSEAALAIRPRGDGEDHGYRALYTIGPSPEYVIVKVPYYADAPDQPEHMKLVRVGKPSPLVELPRELESFEIDSIDQPFLDSETVPSGVEMVWRTHICSVDRSKDPVALGCSGLAAFTLRL